MLDGLRQRVAGLIAPSGGHTAPQPSAGYLRGPAGGPPLVLGVNPPIRDARDDVRASWRSTTSRAIDAMHNNGWISGVVDVLAGLMVGEGLVPNFKPDMSAFGWNEEQTAAWARMVESKYRRIAKDPLAVDAGGRFNLAQMQTGAVRMWFATGEVFCDYPMLRRPGQRYSTRMRILPSHRVVQKTEDWNRIFQGIVLDRHGATAGYRINMEDRWASSYLTGEDKFFPARDRWGRVLMGHAFDGMPGQVRGITPIAPILRVLRDYDQLSGATLAAAMIHAVFAATIESEYPTDAILDALQDEDENENASAEEIRSRFDDFMAQKVGWHQSVDIDLANHGKIAHLMTGEKLNLHAAKHPNAAYQPHANFLLREVARCAGAQFEDMTGDYTGQSYSSIKMAIAKNWPIVVYRRSVIPARVSQWHAENWLEEAIDKGDVELPGGIDAFVAHKAEICSIDWRGPAKPVADELKAAKSHEVYRNMGVVSDEMICADLGVDHEDVYVARAREKKERARLDIHGGVTNGGTDIDELDNVEPQPAPQPAQGGQG